jgi:hypothetical protein
MKTVGSKYHSEWQKARVNYIIDKYGADFFVGKTILELGSYNGYIGACFRELGAKVKCVEGRPENISEINKNYPDLDVECHDLDTEDWGFGHYDIIINFGLYYHLETHHEEFLNNCIQNCDLMLFETVVYDNSEPILFFRDEKGKDQSLSGVGGYPTTNYIEGILKTNDVNYDKIIDNKLNVGGHNYGWIEEKNNNNLIETNRRFWVINTNGKFIN